MAVFTMICVPETRGRSLAEIQSMYGEGRFIIFIFCIQPLSIMTFHEQSFKHYFMVLTQLGDGEEVPPLATVSGTVVKEGT